MEKKPPPTSTTQKAEDPNTHHHCLPLPFKPFNLLAFWVSGSLKKPIFPNGFFALRSRACTVFEKKRRMGDLKLIASGGFSELLPSEEGRRQSSSSSESTISFGEEKVKEDAALGWPVEKSSSGDSELVGGGDGKTQVEEGKMGKKKSRVSDIDLMKERFSKLLLGEDMSGCGKGVCTAVAISNAITNLCATLFGQLWRLEPLPQEKKSMWHREMDWLLCVSDHIVELIPSWQTFPDGSKLEVMTCRQRSDIFINLPALRKLDNMLLEILDSFCDSAFWYVDQGILAPDADDSASFRKHFQRQEEKWWLPVPRVPTGGLHDNARKQLQHKRECTNQILKAAMAINSNTLAEMEVPDPYLESLPKNGRVSLGDVIYRYITSDQFSPECLLDCLEFSSEHQALEIANRVEASIYVWRRKTTTSRPKNNAEKMELFADRAESLLLCLKQRFPGLTQTTLDMSKIQFNKDVGKSILESYSRVLESLAFNIVARIDDLLYVDDLTKHSDHNRVMIPYSVPVSSTPSLSPMPLISPARVERIPFINRKPPSRGFSVKKALTDYLSGETKARNNSNVVEISAPLSQTNE